MDDKTSESAALIATLAQRYGFSTNAVDTALEALRRTGGSAAQFNQPEMGGSVQWMRGGMTQIGDMFNNGLKDRVARLCADLSAELNGALAAVAKPLATAAGRSAASEWPEAWGRPGSAGGQNGIRYAYFPAARRLVVEEQGKKRIVYDTLDYQINGVSQQQGSRTDLTFTSSGGQVPLSKLPVVEEPEA